MNPLREALLRARRRAPRRTGAGAPLQYRGDGLEFAEVRAYVAGDDARRIDWAATARTGTLQSRVFLEETTLTLGVVLDRGPGMQLGRSRPALDAARDAADLWFAIAQGGDRRVALDDLTHAQRLLAIGSALLLVADWSFFAHFDERMAAELGLRCDCTVLIAADPWSSGIPARGFVRIVDARSGQASRAWIGAREERRYLEAARARATATFTMLERCGWRTGELDGEDGAGSLRAAFGLR